MDHRGGGGGVTGSSLVVIVFYKAEEALYSLFIVNVVEVGGDRVPGDRVGETGWVDQSAYKCMLPVPRCLHWVIVLRC